MLYISFHEKMWSLMLYSLSSITMSVLVVLYAFATRIRFYPTVVFLFTSKIASVTMINLAVVFTLLVGFGCTRLFLGRLRDAETDAVWENMRFSVTETAFALTTFRDELNARVGVLFGIMLFAKVFHLLNEVRVEHVEQAQQTTWLAHVRMISLSVTLFLLNSLVLFGCIMHISSYGPSVYFLFAFEHAVLLVTLIATACRYAIAVYDLNFVQGRWQNKSQYEMYVALVSDALQFSAYMVFAGVVFTYYGVPIHLMRSLYMTFRNLTERMTHFIRFRRIMHSLNERFPDATLEELNATDKVCIICREDMEIGGPAGTPKKLQCGHLFHSVCLQNWLERQFSCPTCRRAIPVGVPAAPPVAAQAPAAAQAEVQPPAAPAAAQQPQQPLQAAGVQPVQRQAAQPPQTVPGATGATAINPTETDAARASAQMRERFLQSLNNSRPVAGGEEEKVDPSSTVSSAAAPLSPELPSRKSPAADLDAVLFQDLHMASLRTSPEATDDGFGTRLQASSGSAMTNDSRLKARMDLLQLELKVFEAQMQVVREAHEFARKVQQIQQQHERRLQQQ